MKKINVNYNGESAYLPQTCEIKSITFECDPHTIKAAYVSEYGDDDEATMDEMLESLIGEWYTPSEWNGTTYTARVNKEYYPIVDGQITITPSMYFGNSGRLFEVVVEWFGMKDGDTIKRKAIIDGQEVELIFHEID